LASLNTITFQEFKEQIDAALESMESVNSEAAKGVQKKFTDYSFE